MSGKSLLSVPLKSVLNFMKLLLDLPNPIFNFYWKLHVDISIVDEAGTD